MTKADQLHELIHSLSKNEKGYFKKYCNLYSVQKNPKYLKLFEAIDKEEVYSDKVILQKLEGIIEEKKLWVQKNYLYWLILKVLEQYYANKNPDIEICSFINQAKVLYNKGLFTHSKKVLKKAKQLAETHEFLYFSGEILQFEQKLFDTSAKSKTNYQENKFYFDKELFNLERIKNLIHCRDLERKVIDQHWLKGLNVEEKVTFNRLLEELKIEADVTASTTTAKLHFNQASMLHHYTNGANMEAAFEFAEANFNLIQEFPIIGKRDEYKYIRILYSYLGLCIPLKKEQAFLKGLKTLESFKSKELQTQADVFDLKYNLAFNYVITFHRFEEGKKYISKYQKELPLFMEHLTGRSQIVLHHLVAYIHHINEDYQSAIYAINEIYLLKEEDTRVDIQSVARIQDILIHFDLGNWDLIISKVRNCLRFLKKNNHLYPLNELLLKNINSVAKKPKTGYQHAFEKLKEKINTLPINDPAERKLLDHFDFMSWIKGKVEGTSFKKAFIEK